MNIENSVTSLPNWQKKAHEGSRSACKAAGLKNMWWWDLEILGIMQDV